MERSDAKLTPQNAPWLNDAGAQAVCAAIEAGGHAIYFVGGCVRNALLGESASDIDLSTDALPEQVQQLAAAAGLKSVPTGIDHGTITVIAGGEGYEVTTFRKDVETDGRRAVVAFSDQISDDAMRRDFTMNAIYATSDGRVIDPVNGLQDLKARHLRFIGDAHMRIREDYLRILRFFRFFARYGCIEDGFDPDAIAAISANSAGLETISAERFGSEIKRLLSASDPCFAVAGMVQTGVLAQVLPGADIRLLGPLLHMEGLLGQSPDWRVRLAALGGEDPARRLRLSRAEAQYIDLLKEHLSSMTAFHEIAYRDGHEAAIATLLLRSAISELIPDIALLETIYRAEKECFPIKAADLMDTYQGPELGKMLKQLEQSWLESHFKLTRADLLNQSRR